MTSKYASKAFWIDTFDRVVASTAQGAIAAAGLEGVGVLDVDWVGVASLAGATGLLSLLTSIAFRGNSSSGKPDDPETQTRPYWDPV